ncbi:MAG: patatin family protein [Bacillota bacterium]|nr:patatin family protein [Bacillota bacterium]
MKTGLVLEGGGMRGFFTIGVLDGFMDCGLSFDYIVGVSAGAAHALSYISGQYGRGLRANLDYISDPRYLSMHNLLRDRSIFGMDFIFRELPSEIDPLDYDTLASSTVEYKVGATNIETGKIRYFSKEELGDDFLALRASTSLPFVAQPVEIDGKKYMDGGIGDPIPVRRALLDGCDKIVVVLTRSVGYKKKPQSFRRAYTSYYRKYPAYVKLMDCRHKVYSAQQKLVSALEKEGKAVVIAPSASNTNTNHFEKRRDVLLKLYEHGYNTACEKFKEITALFKE